MVFEQSSRECEEGAETPQIYLLVQLKKLPLGGLQRAAMFLLNSSCAKVVA